MNVQEIDVFESDFIGGNRLVQNKKIKGQNNNTICYSFEDYASDLFELYETGKFPKNINKDLERGDIINIKNIRGIRDNTLIVELDRGIDVEIPLSKEKKFIELFGHKNVEDFIAALETPELKESFLENDLQVYIEESHPTQKASLWKAYIKKIQQDFLLEIEKPTKAYVAKVLEANKGGYFVEVQGVNAFMPGSLSAPNKLTNFGNLIGQEVIVMIEDYIQEMKSFIVSHKKYIEYVLPEKIKELDLDITHKGTITGTSKYGIFIEFNEIFTGLLHISKMLPDTVDEFKARKYSAGDPIEFYINEVTKDNRLILTEHDPVIKKQKIEELIDRIDGNTVEAEIAAIMNFGIIVNVEDQAGLIPNKEFRKRSMFTKDFNIKDKIDVEFESYNDGKITFKLPTPK